MRHILVKRLCRDHEVVNGHDIPGNIWIEVSEITVTREHYLLRTNTGTAGAHDRVIALGSDFGSRTLLINGHTRVECCLRSTKTIFKRMKVSSTAIYDSIVEANA